MMSSHPLQLLIVLGMAGVAASEVIEKAQLPKGTVKVVAYLYDYTVTGSKWIETNDKLHPGIVAKYTTTLSDDETEALLDAFTEKHQRRQTPWCEPRPHHGFLFYGEEEKVLGSVSVCFQCRTTHSKQITPTRDDLASFWDWRTIRALFEENGIPVLKEDADYTNLRNKLGEQAEDAEAGDAPE